MSSFSCDELPRAVLSAKTITGHCGRLSVGLSIKASSSMRLDKALICCRVATVEPGYGHAAFKLLQLGLDALKALGFKHWPDHRELPNQ